MQLGMEYCKVLIFHFHYLVTFRWSILTDCGCLEWISRLGNILCSKIVALEHKKIRQDHLCKTSQWPFISDSSQLYLVSHKKVWLTVCRSLPVILTDNCALIYLFCVEKHIKRRLKLKLKTQWSNLWLRLQMISYIRKFKTKTKTWKLP